MASLDDWRGKTLAEIRRIILLSDPDVEEAWKWRGTPVWSQGGVICVAKAFKDKVKVTFYQGAHLPDPHGTFNNGLDGKQWRSIDLGANDEVDEGALVALVQAAIAYNHRDSQG